MESSGEDQTLEWSEDYDTEQFDVKEHTIPTNAWIGFRLIENNKIHWFTEKGGIFLGRGKGIN